jgi:hypothetical protein
MILIGILLLVVLAILILISIEQAHARLAHIEKHLGIAE